MHGMFKNHIKIIFRNIIKKSLFSGINIFGMSAALAIATAIFIYVSHELSYDSYHSKSDRIYRVTYSFNNQNGYDIHWARVNQPWINELPETFPEIEQLVRFQSFRPRNIIVGENKFREENAFATDAEVFDLFDFYFISGSPELALTTPYSVVLTRSTALKYFGNTNSLGKEIIILNQTGKKEVFTVTALIEDQPSNTHLPITLLTSINRVGDRTGWAYTYILLYENTQIEKITWGIHDFLESRIGEGVERLSIHFQPIADIHLHSNLSREIVQNGNYDLVIIFSLVAIFLLVIAAVNFANLNTIQSYSRSKEVGLRKVMGADSAHLKGYFLLEAFVLTSISAMLGFGIVAVFFATLQNFIGHELHFNWSLFCLISILAVIMITVISGLYPAQVISRFSPVVTLYGFSDHTFRGSRLRRLLVGLQFVISIGLVSSTLIIHKQFSFIYHHNLGYDQDQVLAITHLPEEVTKSYETLKQQLKRIPGVDDVTAVLEIPTIPIKDEGRVQINGKPEEDNLPIADMQIIDINALEVLGMELLAGSTLSESLKSVESVPGSDEDFLTYLEARRREYLINESAMKLFGWSNPEEAIGNLISWSIGNISLKQGPVVGVVRDYHQESLKVKIDPLILTYEPIWLQQVLVKIDGKNISEVVRKVEHEWDQLFSDYPMERTFLDREFDRLYQSENKQLQLISIFTVVAIFIAFLGLFGLVAYTLKTRLKEMAIRKVLGATIKEIVILLGREYAVLTILSIVIAVPVIWYFMNVWLQNYAYHVVINGISFGLASGLIILILVATLIFQTWKGTSRNPAEVLKYE